ncbi:uncharacterized protein LOC127865214 [Dreissena polymorpha]|uniref:Myb/SANT-like DNA-binding domain-containing protein n=1 Tax=Dreissena polymorpha TaxID=45954 RepID=A0A9D4NKL6_DREPO|nr:uncharacterized protein LOC127865214 [Dreissena polymorpha]KAH3895991.1 hypothetical protein DPMN_020160 [Dreissena polymorpha]
MFQCEDCECFFTDMDVFKTHACVTNQKSPAQSVFSEEGNDTNNNQVWNKAQTQLLIRSYQLLEAKVSQGKLRKKSMWEKISEEMREKGYNFSAEQVSGRWKTLIRAYKNIKAHNAKSGSSLKTYQFENELDEIFAKDPVMTPVKTMSSASQVEESSEDDQMELTKKRSSSEKDSDKNKPPAKKSKSKVSGSQQMVQMLQSFTVDQAQREREEAERTERRHEERMQLMRGLVDAIKQSAPQAPTKNRNN